jgi:hypothetical protein
MSGFVFAQPQLHRLVTLLQQVHDQSVRVPRFQRPMVWPKDRRLLLLDSVFNGYPIGSIFLWNVPVGKDDRPMPAYDHVGPLSLPPVTAALGAQSWLLDGHQRIGTLFGMLGLAMYPPEAEANAWHPTVVREDWEAFFDLDATDEKDAPRFLLLSPAERKPARHVPLSIILNGYRLGVEQRRLIDLKRSERDVLKLQNLADRIRETLIPVVYLATDDLDVVTEAYTRVNSQATPMSKLHMVKALAWTSRIDIEQEVNDRADRLPPLWKEFGKDWILDTAKLLLGLPIYKVDERTVAKSVAANREVLNAATDVIQSGVELLKCVGLRGPRYLPYALQIILLGLEGRNSAVLDKERVRRWFWGTTLSTEFQGAFDSTIEMAQQHLHQYLTGSAKDPLPKNRRPVGRVRFDSRSARTRGQCLLLAWIAEGRPEQWSGDVFEELERGGADATLRPLPNPGTNSIDLKRAWESIASRVVGITKNELLAAFLTGDLKILERHSFEEADVELYRIKDYESILLNRRQRFERLEKQLAHEWGLGLEFTTTEEAL